MEILRKNWWLHAGQEANRRFRSVQDKVAYRESNCGLFSWGPRLFMMWEGVEEIIPLLTWHLTRTLSLRYFVSRKSGRENYGPSDGSRADSRKSQTSGCRRIGKWMRATYFLLETAVNTIVCFAFNADESRCVITSVRQNLRKNL